MMFTDMGDFKHVIREGSGYQIRQYKLLQHVIVLAWVLISIVVITSTGYLKTGIVLLIISVLLTIASFTPPKVYFDPASKLLTLTNNGLNRKKFTYNLDDFEGFELQSFSIALIPLGCFLYANFKNVSQLKRPAITQSFSKKTLQEVVNELESLNRNM